MMPNVELLPSTHEPSFLAALRRHYTRSAGPPPGRKLAWRVGDAWIGLGEPAYKLAPRRRLGLLDARPAPRTVCQFLFRREEPRGPWRGSDLLRAWHAVASEHWETRYGWAPDHWETLVLPSAVESPVPGACYRRVGYRSLGLTTGRGARRPPGATHGPRVWTDTEPKLVLYRGPLRRIDGGAL
jgi:hypothetical protein